MDSGRSYLRYGLWPKLAGVWVRDRVRDRDGDRVRGRDKVRDGGRPELLWRGSVEVWAGGGACGARSTWEARLGVGFRLSVMVGAKARVDVRGESKLLKD